MCQQGKELGRERMCQREKVWDQDMMEIHSLKVTVDDRLIENWKRGRMVFG